MSADAASDRAADAVLFRDALRRRNVEALRVAALIGYTLVPAFWILDWIVLREHVAPLGGIRLFLAGYALLLEWQIRTRRDFVERYDTFFTHSLAALVAWAIEAMVFLHEGYSSPYYAGITLVVITVGFLFSWSNSAAVAFQLIVYVPFLLPAVLGLVPVGSPPRFVSHQFFLVSTMIIVLLAQAFRRRLEAREFYGNLALERTKASLEQALDRLKDLDRLKSQFFSNVTHELRTPLTLIIAPVDELLEDEGLRDRHAVLAGVRRNAERLLRLINDFLDLARLDAGGLRLSVARLDLGALAAEVVDTFRPAAVAKSMDLRLEVAPIAAEVHGDPHRIEIVLTNLVGNALKFTPEGGDVEVSVGPAEGGAELRVADTGPGIPVEDRERVFDRFFQVEGSERRVHGGTGIGLALARELVALHGGQIRVEGREAGGTVFRVWLPEGREHFRPEVLERRRAQLGVGLGRRAEDHVDPGPVVPPAAPRSPAAAAEAPVTLDGGRRPRVLVAEDQAELRDLLSRLLSESYEVLVAADGDEALDLARRERPDLVLSDVMMPHRTGTDLCREIKADPGLRGTPVVLLTARSGSDSALDGYAHGADDFVVKPFHARLLLARIHAQLRLRSLGLQVVAQARLAAVGTLAAGVAHEVRNPLNAVLNAARVLVEAEDLPAGQVRRLLEVVLDGAIRIQAIASALDQHARPGDDGGVAPVDVRAGLDATLRLLEHRSGMVTVHREYRTSRRAVARAGPLNQVFLNVLDNALRSGAAHVYVDVADAGDRVVVRIGDDGPGVPPQIADRVFDPFFTTRGPGEGTGLGLYLSRQIVADWGGSMELGRARAGGAEFVIGIPAEGPT